MANVRDTTHNPQKSCFVRAFFCHKAEATNLEREALLARKLLIAQQAGKEIGSMNLLDDRVKKLTQRSAAIQSEEARVEKMIKGSTAALAKAERETLGAKSAADQANAKVTSPTPPTHTRSRAYPRHINE